VRSPFWPTFLAGFLLFGKRWRDWLRIWFLSVPLACKLEHAQKCYLHNLHVAATHKNERPRDDGRFPLESPYKKKTLQGLEANCVNLTFIYTLACLGIRWGDRMKCCNKCCKGYFWCARLFARGCIRKCSTKVGWDSGKKGATTGAEKIQYRIS